MSVTFPSSSIVMAYAWSFWKALVAAKGLVPRVQFDDDGPVYTIYVFDDQVIYTCTIWKGTVPDGVLASYSQEQNDADRANFEAKFKPYANRAIEPRTSDGKSIISLWPTEGTRKTVVTHNWADKTTWYQKSIHVVDEAPIATTPGTLYTLGHQHVIDTHHGKLWDEDTLGYRVLVVVDGVAKTEQDPHDDVGDFLVDYDAGTITFTPPVDPGAIVLVSYHYAGVSTFVIAPAPGKSLKIRSVEAQFSTDVILADTIDFAAYGYVDAFAPQLMPGIPSGTKIPLGPPTRYKTMLDFQAESNGAMPVIPAIGGPSWRGIRHPIIVFPWDYAALLTLSSAAGMEIRIKLLHDVPFGGEFGTATLYCLSEDETP